MTTKIDQKAYLQKYLGGPSKDKKKKKKKVAKGSGFKIIDDDIDLSKLRPLEGDELDILDGGEDAPQIAGIIDERPEDLKKMEQFKTSSKWRVINEDDGFNSKLQIQEIKKDIKEVEKENEVIFGKMYSDSEDEQQKNDSDLSPPRQNSKKHDHNSDFSPPRREKSQKTDKKYDSDVSPPRRKEGREKVRKPSRWGDVDTESSNHTSPKRKSSKSQRKHESPKRKHQNDDSDASPPRKRKSSPQKDRNRKRSPSSDLSPPRNVSKDKGKNTERNTHRHKTDQRYSKDNRNKNYNSDSDISPPRRDSRKDKQALESSKNPKGKRRSPSSNKRKYNSDSDISPPRKNNIPKDKRYDKSSAQNSKRKHDSDSDLSPPRKDKEGKRRNSDSPPPSNKKMARTLEGKKAGLQDARQLRQENEEFRRKEDDVFKKLGDDVSGRNAKAVSRKGKRETSEERQKHKEKAERQKELDAKYKVWSRGVKQIEAQEARVQEFLHEASKPLARHKDDKDLESNLKQIERAGDPMLDYIRDKKRERGELPPERPSYKGSFPPNRFNIRPGYRWDGVDRSNGYEKKYFEQQSKKKALEEEAYKWSTEDL